MNKRFLMIGIAGILTIVFIFALSRIVFKPNPPKSTSIASLRADEAEFIMNKAKKLVAQSETDAAIRNLENLITKYPESAQTESGYAMLAGIYEERQDLLKARDIYQKIIERYPNSSNIAKIQENLENLNIKILFLPTATPDSLIYEIQKGDTLSSISKKFNTTVELIVKANDLKSPAVKSGKKLKISKARFSIVVDKAQNILTLKSDGSVFKTYRVSTGKNSCTPVGNFTIINRIIDPPWYPPTGGMVQSGDPKNVLGSRWMGLSKQGYGIHGTIDPASIGKSVTEGCVRMKNSDVEELYSIVPAGTDVLVVD